MSFYSMSFSSMSFLPSDTILTFSQPLTPLSRDEHAFQIVEKGFKKKWLHTSKYAQIHAIYGITEGDLARSYRGKRFARSMNGGVYRHLFHGTRRACRIGDPGTGLLTPCHRESCSLCGILRKSFTITGARPGSMFGPGIYTTEVSSKADIYVRNHHVRSNMHAMLLCRVAYNRPQLVSVADHSRICPDAGYDCVEAVRLVDGGSVDYPETVVYRDDAIVPVALIMYTRQGWEP
ncbi:hypothetical protein B0T26DRAFT_874084 [Lasiosphaeria miniovina]|uniref:PARP catalytic domain-containing protein n=1 Tax=Lasiosphaeria miniovina TaxID=1954250 RepID=A0AA40DWB8_9PEZI|nr:uncharacterized protein B0T26DRAFT_874084 [Lasiosphaeria miniovina]KAK0714138.1 hypothetical protein B0T26DRAFT_874084 [Lasiosphaeria miniovina]